MISDVTVNERIASHVAVCVAMSFATRFCPPASCQLGSALQAEAKRETYGPLSSALKKGLANHSTSL